MSSGPATRIKIEIVSAFAGGSLGSYEVNPHVFLNTWFQQVADFDRPCHSLVSEQGILLQRYNTFWRQGVRDGHVLRLVISASEDSRLTREREDARHVEEIRRRCQAKEDIPERREQLASGTRTLQSSGDVPQATPFSARSSTSSVSSHEDSVASIPDTASNWS